MMTLELDPTDVGRAARATLRWPNADAMFEGAWTPDWRRRAKYLARMAITVNARARLLQECAANEIAQTLLAQHPRAFYPLMSHLLDRRLGLHERLQATLASVHAVPDALGRDHVDALMNGGLALLALDDGSQVMLSLSRVSYHEGLWQLGLQSAQGQRLYSLGFGMLTPSCLLIANVQGPSLGGDGLEQNRQSTHAAHGMRPPYLLLHALKALASHWRVPTLLGIDPVNHVKGRWNLRQSRLKFDYRGFWRDHGGVLSPSGHWALPLMTPRRPLDDVPSKRRAMYRRRQALLDRLEATIQGLAR